MRNSPLPSNHRHYWQRVPYIAELLLVLGLLGGGALRLTIFAAPWGQNIVNGIWYFGVISYTVFYAVRISIETHRREVCDQGLIKRLKEHELSYDDIEILSAMVKSHCNSKVKYNYIAWLAISVISLISALILT
ncbi:hypothetical protein CO046_01655 [Candidatus Peregrinibacteria bacterium CG_4_9_14_0_2_um_filter_53_11]|nr:MAG: hypothetical protein CO046_01655 [Candidatus Peregrinibacteria bacterium CG_4_9_14_0_2_um_filter_53_11]